MERKKSKALLLLLFLVFLLPSPVNAYTYQEMGAGAQALVQEILEQVRPREAMVLEVINQEIYINLGRDEVTRGQLFEVFGVGQVILDPVTGETLGTTEEIRGIIEIQRIRDRTAIGVVVGELASLIRPGDKVYQKIEGDRKTVAVYRFATASGHISELSWNLQEMVISRLARTHTFQIIERQQIDQLLEEYHFSYTGLIDQSTAQEAGLLLGANTVLMGSLSDLGESIEINARLTETETGRTLATSTIRVEKDQTLEGMLGRILEEKKEEVKEEVREPREILLTGIRILPRSGEIQIEKEMTFIARGIDETGKEIVIHPSWIVRGGIGELRPTRGDQVIFKATELGEGQIEVELGALQAIVPIKVVPPPRILTSLEIIPGNIQLDPNEGMRFIARGRDQYGNYMAVEPYWYVLRGVGEVVPERGPEIFFRATNPGEGNLVAEVSGIRTIVPVRVRDFPTLQRLEIEIDEETLIIGKTYNIKAIGWDQYGASLGISPEWSITDELGDLVPARGSVTTFYPWRPGIGTLTATHNRISTSISLEVIEAPLARLVVEPGEIVLKTGESQSLTVKGYDIFGKEKPVEAQWKVEGNVGSLSSVRENRVTFQATRAGSGFLVVQAEDVISQVRIRVQERIPTSMIIRPGDTQVYLGRPVVFTATVLDQDHQMMNIAPNWWVEDDLGRLSSTTGNTIIFTPTRRGTGRLVASIGGVRREAHIRVSYRGVGLSYIEIEPLDLSLPVLTFSSGGGIRGSETGLSYKKIEYEGDPGHLLWFQNISQIYLRLKKPSPFLAFRSNLGLGYFGEDSSRPGDFDLIELKQGIEGGILVPIGRRLELMGSYGYAFDTYGFYESYMGYEEKELEDLFNSYFNFSLRFLF